MEIENVIRYPARAVGLMVCERFIRYAGLAIGLKPSARGCEGRLRGLYHVFKDHQPSARGCEARLRGLYPFYCLKLITRLAGRGADGL